MLPGYQRPVGMEWRWSWSGQGVQRKVKPKFLVTYCNGAVKRQKKALALVLHFYPAKGTDQESAARRQKSSPSPCNLMDHYFRPEEEEAEGKEGEVEREHPPNLPPASILPILCPFLPPPPDIKTEVPGMGMHICIGEWLAQGRGPSS